MFDCALLLECIAGALAGIGIICLCWRLRRPLRLAQHYDVNITEEGMYGALPIYGYLRRYCFILLLAGCVVLLVSVVGAVRAIHAKCSSDGVAALVLTILGLLLGIHLPTVAAFETAKHRHRLPYPITALVETVRKRLWGVAVFLLLIIGLVALFGTLE